MYAILLNLDSVGCINIVEAFGPAKLLKNY